MAQIDEMQISRVKDIYVGKPDAKDEINFDGTDGFVRSYVVPESYDIEGLIEGNYCFITGYKGVGKTALLFYLEYLIKQEAPHACTSFVFFKDNYTEIQKQELAGFSKRLSSFVAFDESNEFDNEDFEHIWRWLFLKRIVSDNEDYSDNLFVDDQSWREFKSVVDSIKAPTDSRKSIIPSKIKVAAGIKDPNTFNELTPEIELDLTKKENYSDFIYLINKAETLLANVSRTDTPYFILIDELEAYYGEDTIFKRDLRFIRDLIFTVKRYNEIFKRIDGKTKIICSVRTEIINAIYRFVVSKEINKVVNGFEVPIIWNYNNTSSYQHPLIKVLLKRISLTADNANLSDKELFDKWFPEKINEIDPAAYILNNSWNKPRDIVRLISSAQNCIKRNEYSFNAAVFYSLKKKYSEDSLSEIREELRALYTSEEIELIITCFTGFKTVFSYNSLKERITSHFKDTILDTNLNGILNDLYRLGFLGNYLPLSRTYRWQHKGDSNIIISDEWRIMIHYALQSSLSLNSRQNYALNANSDPEVGDVVNVVVTNVIPSFVFVMFDFNNKKQYGVIHVRDLGLGFVRNIYKVIKIGDEYRATILDFNEEHNNWLLKKIDDENNL